MSRDVLKISRIFSSCINKAARFFSFGERERESSVECSKKALFCGDFWDRNQAIIFVVLVLVSLIFI